MHRTVGLARRLSAWLDSIATMISPKISFTRYSRKLVPPRTMKKIRVIVLELELIRSPKGC